MEEITVFSNGFEHIEDINESKIGVCLASAVNEVVDALDGHIVDKIPAAFASDAIKEQIEAVHEFLGDKFLDVSQLFSSRHCVRKMSKDNLSAENCGNLNAINKSIRTSAPDSLNYLYYMRGLALKENKLFELALRDFGSLLTVMRRSEVYQVHYNIAKIQGDGMGEREKALESLRMAKESLVEAELCDKEKNDFDKTIEALVAHFRMKILCQSNGVLQTHDKVSGPSDVPEILTGQDKTIMTGTEVVFEDFRTIFLNPESRLDMFRLCLHCLEPTVAPLPCSGCSHVVFCSRSCASKSAVYHQFECQLDLYSHRQTDSQEIFMIFSPLKMILQKPMEFFMQNWDRETCQQCLDCDSSYSRLWSIPLGLEKSIFERAEAVVRVVFLLRCLRLTSYLGVRYQDEQVARAELKKEELLLGTILHRFLLLHTTYSIIVKQEINKTL